MGHHVFVRDQHPFIFVLNHYVNLLAMTFLTLSGFYIHFPIFPGFMGVARGTHFFWMFLLLINLVVRIALAFVVKDSDMLDGTDIGPDWRNFVPQKENRGTLFPAIGYYLFVVKNKPNTGKYGPLQKFAYVLTVPLTLLAAWTGFALWGPTMNWGLFAGAADLFGSIMNVRIAHFYTMWAILLFTLIHAYLASIHGVEPLRIMFAWKETTGAEQ